MGNSFTSQDVLERGVDEIIKQENLKKHLKSRKKLRVKFGIDPTGPDLHLGHTVPLWKLRQFQDLGHKIVLIIGDFTATIGDPSGQSEERKPLTDKEVKKNMKRYIDQVGKILDIKKTEIHRNSEWHKKEGLDAALQLARTASLQQLTKRSDFAERIKKGSDITFIELFYPLLQAYDSVKVKADVEIGGTDQKFNLLMGRQVQRRYGQKEQDIITLPILVGTDGVKKMSKSYNNYIALLDKPANMFGKVMSINDTEIANYFELTTPIDFEEVKKIKEQKTKGAASRDLKTRLAKTIVETYWGEEAASKSEKRFGTQFKEGGTPNDLSIYNLKNGQSVEEVVANSGMASSKSEARRLIKQGGVYFEDKRVLNPKEKINEEGVLRVGKRKYRKLKK